MINEEQRARGVVGWYVIVADGYKAHDSIPLYRWCHDNQIIYTLLFANTTHITQPCDLTIFRPLKAAYVKDAMSFKVEQKKNDINEADFVSILGGTIKRTLNDQIIKNGFEASGLFPIDRSRVHDDRLLGTPHFIQHGNVSELSGSSIVSSSTFNASSMLSASNSVDETSSQNGNFNASVVEFSMPEQNVEIRQLPFQEPSMSLSDEIATARSNENRRKQLLEEMSLITSQWKELSNDPLEGTIFEQQLALMQSKLNENPNSRGESLAKILPLPPLNMKKGQRKRKKDRPTCGIMSNGDSLEKYDLIEDEEAKEAAEKEQRKNERLEKKKQKELQKKIATPKKRGRPKKNQVAEDEDVIEI